MSTTPIPLSGVIGHPVAHSLSPRLHNHWLRQLGLPGQYVPLEVKPEDFAAALRMLPRLGFAGANVTIPHKEAALDCADSSTERARRIGAANTLVFGAGGHCEADNTDAYGFSQNLGRAAPDWDPAAAPALVLGAGGAARGIVVALIDMGVPEIRLANRTRSRADSLASDFCPTVRVIDWTDAPAHMSGVGLVVNTTAIGMGDDAAFPLSLDALQPGTLATDIVYTPPQTPFLRAAAERGARTVDGLGMLFWQAVPGFAAWFGARPEIGPDLRAAILAP